MNMLSVMCFVETTYRPEGLSLDPEIEGFDYQRAEPLQLPFLPVAGMFIDCGDGDLREVTDVFYWAQTGGLSLHFKEDDMHYPHARWLANGWVEAGAPASTSTQDGK